MPFLGSEAPRLEVKDWINSDPISLAEGTHLIDFWIYSCRCCIQRAERLRKLHEEYPVNVIGIHYPGYSFEEEHENVRKEVERRGIDYPVALDTGKETWKNYGGEFGPRQVIVKDGDVVWQNSTGSGSIEEALAEALGIDEKEVIRIGKQNQDHTRSYLGFRGCEGINGQGNFKGEKEYSIPDNRKKYDVYLDGLWRQEEEFLESRGGSLSSPFHASSVGLVADPGGGIRDIEVEVDGKPVPHSIAGDDLRVENGESYVRVKRPRFYSILEGQRRSAEITFRPEKGTRMYEIVFERQE